MKFPLEKYTYYMYTTKTGTKEVIAISTYGGKIVKGTAKCNPVDGYDEEKGKALAAARCNTRIAKKRKMRAEKKFKEADYSLKEALRHYEKMLRYYEDSNELYDIAVNEEAATVSTL